VPAIGDYFVGEAQGESGVGSGQGHDVPVGPFGGAGAAGVNDDQLGAVALGLT
jgi:hypothetical protein